MAQNENLPANDNIGRIDKLVDLVEYMEGSITTKTLADKKVGRVDLFAFTEGQGLGEHFSRFDDLAYILDGEAEITDRRQSISCQSRRNDYLTGKQNTCHQCKKKIQDDAYHD